MVWALALPQLQIYVAQRAGEHAAQAEAQHSVQQAIIQYRLAQILDPGNVGYHNRLADLYLTENQPDQAINVLGVTDGERIRKANLLLQRGQYSEALSATQPLSTPAGAIVRSQVYLEEGSDASAITAVLHGSTKIERTQLILSYLVAGKAAEAQQLVQKNLAANPELASVQYGGFALAQELYARQLYRSAQRVLTTSVDDSPTKYLLLANTVLAEQPHSQDQLTAAQAAVGQGLKLDPANLPLHQLLHDLDVQLGDQSGATQQLQLINQLRSGTL